MKKITIAGFDVVLLEPDKIHPMAEARQSPEFVAYMDWLLVEIAGGRACVLVDENRKVLGVMHGGAR